jgi:hypothetical protein
MVMAIGLYVEKHKVTIHEMWVISDKWWLPKDEQIRREYAEVDWNGRRLIFAREAPDTVWRITKI